MILTISKILGNTPKSVSNWKNEKRPIISLLYKYFSKEELEEFLSTGKIDKFENIYFIQNFYQEQFFQFFQIILHSSDKHDAFKCMGGLFSSEIENFENFETYLIKLNKDFKISDIELINFIKSPPISNELFIYIKSNILNNWATFKNQLKASSDAEEKDDDWILEFIELMTIVNDKNLFDEIFFDAYGIRRIPNPPISAVAYEEESITNSKSYTKIIKRLIEQIKQGALEDSLYIDVESEPFDVENEKFILWIK